VTDRQKFWLKVVLTVTFPVWFAPFVMIGAVGFCAWRIVSALVDDPTSQEGQRP